jgi:hypothetical protein
MKTQPEIGTPVYSHHRGFIYQIESVENQSMFLYESGYGFGSGSGYGNVSGYGSGYGAGYGNGSGYGSGYGD